VKLLLEARSRRYAVGAAAAILLLAGCSGSRSLPSTGAGLAQPFAAAPVGAHATLNASPMMVPDACSDPAKLKVCIAQGGTYHLKLALTCHLGSQSASCGTVTWKTHVSNGLIKAKFKPDPGNPTVETIMALKAIKLGHYTQTISITCTGVPNCSSMSKGQIWVIK
jgi:hypothetical protein